MNPSQKPLRERTREEIDAEIERMAREQGVERFNFNEAFGEGSDLISDEELEDFLQWRQEVRKADRAAQEKQWRS